jgi:hypothetical protein
MLELLNLIQMIEVTFRPLSWFLPQTLLLYAGLIIAKRIAAIPLRTITLILTPSLLLGSVRSCLGYKSVIMVPLGYIGIYPQGYQHGGK